MKLHADRPDQFSITAYGDDWVAVNGQQHTGSLVISATAGVRPWSCATFAQLSADHFAQLLAEPNARPELVIFGSGPRLRFAHPALLRPLIDARIGVETMDTIAACRTFNVLAAEGRQVTAVLLMGD